MTKNESIFSAFSKEEREEMEKRIEERRIEKEENKCLDTIGRFELEDYCWFVDYKEVIPEINLYIVILYVKIIHITKSIVKFIYTSPGFSKDSSNRSVEMTVRESDFLQGARKTKFEALLFAREILSTIPHIYNYDNLR